MASKSLKVLVGEVKATQKIVSDLYEEQSTCCDHDRYTKLSMPGGLIRKAHDAHKKARERLQKRLKAVTGVYAYELKDLI